MATQPRRKGPPEETVAQVLRGVGVLGLLLAAGTGFAALGSGLMVLFISLAVSLAISSLLFFACARGIELLAAISHSLERLRYEQAEAPRDYDSRSR